MMISGAHLFYGQRRGHDFADKRHGRVIRKGTQFHTLIAKGVYAFHKAIFLDPGQQHFFSLAIKSDRRAPLRQHPLV
jgi:hypothetical protein